MKELALLGWKSDWRRSTFEKVHGKYAETNLTLRNNLIVVLKGQ